MSVLYTVFAPTAPLSRTRWNYYQHEDGSVTRTITTKFGESKPLDMNVSEIFPDALSWARCLHGGKKHFEDCPEAEEIYSTLCNVKLHVERGSFRGAEVCLEGIINDCKEWQRQLKEREVAA